MASASRPGSLTLFAVLNFVLAGLGIIGLLFQLGALLLRGAGHPPGGHGHDPFAGVPPWWIWTALAGSAVHCALLVVSGIGLLKQSVLLGRWGATAAAVIALALVVGDQAMVGSGTGFEAPMRLLGLAMGALHPLLLLLWVNVILADLWRPPRVPAPGGDQRPSSPFLLTAGQALRQSLRGVSGPGFTFGLVFAGLIVCFALLLASAIGTKVGETTGYARSANQRTAMLEHGTAGMLSFILRERAIDSLSAEGDQLEAPAQSGPNEEPLSRRWARFLVQEHPAGLSFAWLILLLVVPLAANFVSCGQISRDISNRGFRFLLTRVDRDRIFLGRFAAAAALCSAVVVLTVAVCAAVMGFAEPQPAWGAILAWSGWAAGALVLASLPFVALGMLCSTVTGHSFASLSAAKGIVIGWPLAALTLSRVWDPLFHGINLLPLVVQFGLFHPSPWVAAGAAIACLGYTALYLWLGLLHFRRRDL